MDIFEHENDGGRYRMRRWNGRDYVYKCNKCGKEKIVRYIDKPKTI